MGLGCPIDALLGEVGVQEIRDHLLERNPTPTELGHWGAHGFLDTLPHRHKTVGGARILAQGEFGREATPSGEHLPGTVVGGGAEVAAHHGEGVGVGGGGWGWGLLGHGYGDSPSSSSRLCRVFAGR